MISYTLTRSRRRTIAIYIRNGLVEVRAPLKMAKRDIEKFVASKEPWIMEHLAQARERLERRQAFTLNYGDTVTFRGARCLLTEKAGTYAGFDGEAFYLPPCLAPEEIKFIVQQICRQLAKRFLIERVAHYAGLMSTAPTAVKINSAKTRWGSCSTNKTLNFSWLLVQADDEVIDYVVVHELAHLAEMNHSARFWTIVSGVLPDFKERQKRLKDLQQRLNAEDWR